MTARQLLARIRLLAWHGLKVAVDVASDRQAAGEGPMTDDLRLHLAWRIVRLLIEEIDGLERIPPTLKALRYELVESEKKR